MPLVLPKDADTRFTEHVVESKDERYVMLTEVPTGQVEFRPQDQYQHEIRTGVPLDTNLIVDQGTVRARDWANDPDPINDAGVMPGFSNYLVTMNGQIYSHFSKKFLQPAITEKGYYRGAMVNDEGQVKNIRFNQAVGIVHCPREPNHTDTNHLNSKKLDNRGSNIAWGTARENMSHAHANGLTPYGTVNHRAIRTEEEVREIRNLYAMGGHSMRGLGREYGSDHKTIGMIIRGELYGNVR